MKKRLPLSGKQVLLSTFFISMAAILLAAHNTVADAVREGLLLCAHSVIPALFPMFTAVTLAIRCGLGTLLPPQAAALILGLVGGYPVGGRTIAELLQNGSISRQQAQRLLCCCNNAGPAFILGIAGVGVFHSTYIGWVLYLLHMASALLLAALLIRPGQTVLSSQPPPNLSAAFVESVCSAVTAMVNVCGFVVLFWTVLSLLRDFTSLTHPLLLGAVELTNGILALPSSRSGFVMAAALLGWGGLSVHCQTAAVLSDSELKLSPYLLAKLAQSVLSAAMAIPVSGLLCL